MNLDGHAAYRQDKNIQINIIGLELNNNVSQYSLGQSPIKAKPNS